MKKKLIGKAAVFILAGILAFALQGCAGREEAPAGESGGTAAEEEAEPPDGKNAGEALERIREKGMEGCHAAGKLSFYFGGESAAIPEMKAEMTYDMDFLGQKAHGRAASYLGTASQGQEEKAELYMDQNDGKGIIYCHLPGEEDGPEDVEWILTPLTGTVFPFPGEEAGQEGEIRETQEGGALAGSFPAKALMEDAFFGNAVREICIFYGIDEEVIQRALEEAEASFVCSGAFEPGSVCLDPVTFDFAAGSEDSPVLMHGRLSYILTFSGWGTVTEDLTEVAESIAAEAMAVDYAQD